MVGRNNKQLVFDFWNHADTKVHSTESFPIFPDTSLDLTLTVTVFGVSEGTLFPRVEVGFIEQ